VRQRSSAARGETVRKRVEPGQALSRQPVSQRRLAPVDPRLRHRDLAADAARAHEHHAGPAAPGIQHLQPLHSCRSSMVGFRPSGWAISRTAYRGRYTVS
jgi:hypothetical protein